MMYTASLTKTGQATIPKVVRDILGITPGEDTKITYTTHKDGSVTIAKEMTDEEAFAYLDSLKSEKTKKIIARSAGKTVREMIDEWESSPEGQKYLKKRAKERYGIELA